MENYENYENCGAVSDAGEVCDCTNPKPQKAQIPQLCLELPDTYRNPYAVAAKFAADVARVRSLPKDEDSLKIVKKLRSANNAAFAEAEAKRGEIKDRYMAPYNTFLAVYDKYISKPHAAADAEMKAWVDDYQDGLKKKCEGDLRDYFKEACANSGIDFVHFEQVGIKVDMALARQQTPKKAIETIDTFVSHVREDVAAIMDMDNAAEILGEYRRSLNLGASVAAVSTRHRQMEEEASRIAAQRIARQKEAAAVQCVTQAAPELAAITPASASEPEKLTLKFAVVGTRKQLQDLVGFMRDSGLHYYDLK